MNVTLACLLQLLAGPNDRFSVLTHHFALRRLNSEHPVFARAGQGVEKLAGGVHEVEEVSFRTSSTDSGALPLCRGGHSGVAGTGRGGGRSKPASSRGE